MTGNNEWAAVGAVSPPNGAGLSVLDTNRPWTLVEGDPEFQRVAQYWVLCEYTGVLSDNSIAIAGAVTYTDSSYQRIEVDAPMRDENWQIVATYARRVQRINFCQGNLGPLTLEGLVSRLRPTGDDQCVFPNIRALFCSIIYADKCLPTILRMMSPDLQEFSLDFTRVPGETGLLGLAVQTLQVLSSTPFLSLTKIRVSGDILRDRHTFEAFLVVVKLQRNLQVLAVHSSGFVDFLDTFGYSYQLTSLTMEHLTPSLNIVARLFDRIESSYPNLEDFSVKLQENLEGKLPLSKQRTLRLRTLRILGVGSKHLTVETVSAMGEWWPHMNDFEFGRQSMIPMGECASLCRLHDIARVWPELRSLAVVFELQNEILPRPEYKFRNIDSLTLRPIQNRSHDEYVRIADFLAVMPSRSFVVQL